ncbi:MAG: hypothetical protein EAZ95_10515 [Bacteroidetes bacterium]|nr:MAG: hypothetical protein EAZ95_10515 [Bacteroidota bacterium]
MSYALYGETTGGRKNMRSDYADEKTETEVEFVFRVGMQAHRIVRRLKVSGRIEKSVTEKQFYEQGVWKDGIFTPDKEPLTKKTDIKDKVEHILGFTEAQFKQIIVLPQGNFQEFLRSKNNEKTEVLQKLFNADIYRQIREKLEERGKEYQRKHEELETKITTILQANQLRNFDEIEQLVAQYTQDIAQLEQSLPAVKAQFDKALLTLKDAQELDKIFQELAEAETKLASHTKNQEAMTQLLEKLKRNENAEPFKADMAQLGGLEKQRTSYEANILQQQSIILRTEKKIVEINHILKEHQETWEEIIEQNKLKINDLEKIKPKFEEISQKEKDLTALSQNLLNAQKDLQNLRVQYDKVVAQEMELKEKAKDLETLKQDKGKFEQILAQMKEKNLAYQQRVAVLEKYKQIEKLVKEASENEQKQGNEAQQKREVYNLLDAQWRNSQAFALAETLEAGKPCPVCGSEHHPQKATQTTQIVSEEQLKKAQKAYDEAEKKYRTAIDTRQQHEKALAEELAVGKSLREQLGELASLTAEQMQARVGEAQTNFAQAQQAEQESAQVQQKITALAQELASIEQKIKTNENKENELKTAIAVQSNLVQALIKDIPKEVNNEAELKERMHRLADEKETAQDLLHKHQQELQTEIGKMEKAKHTIEEDEKHLNGSRTEKRKGILDTIKDLEKSIQNNLAKYGFVETKEVLEAILKEDDKQTFKQKAEKYNAEKTKLQALLDEKKKKIGTRSKPDLALLNQEVGKLEVEYMQNNEKLTKAKTEKDRINQQRNEIDKQQTELQELNETHEGLPELVNVANGKNEMRQKFEIFVLSVFLDEVLHYANQRLDLLSNGRYQLERSEDVVDGRKGAGMDLLVFDQYTGTARPVENLSGGETFFTSLALALGLADTAVAQAGGRSLDAMFIDEGFGTLDAETLDLAIKTLHTLSDEQRLVGIISHVAELKERIPAKLEVRKMKNGSVVKIS